MVRKIALVTLLLMGLFGFFSWRGLFDGDNTKSRSEATPNMSTSDISEALKPLSPGDPKASVAAAAAAQKDPTGKGDTGSKCQERRLITQGQGAPGGPAYIASDPAPQTEWGPDCFDLVSGASCEAPFGGSYSSPGDTAYIDFQAWAPEAREPFASRLVGPFPGYGEFKQILFPFKVPEVSSIMLRAVLMDRNGTQLATGSEWIFKVDCKMEAAP